ncbi:MULTISPECIES: tyrosine-type recombinase/integrase [Raoultella]|uniref:tyrosine-type recombinase/integrase n=1 Tax=Raoultella TaxID=160674 RepID=UPI0007DAC6E3|nr:site-specific integrase [Raoultella ornithinolytica]MCZ0881311.1 site-specific integrase [Raoultella ornithinolytica]
MANVQVLSRKTGKVYRVQFMRNGSRVSKVFSRKREAESFLAQITVSDDLADCLTSTALTNTTLSQAIKEYLSQHTGRDTSVTTRLSWWARELGDKPVGKVTRQNIKAALARMEATGKKPATLNRYKAALSAVFAYFNDLHDVKLNPCREIRQLKESNGRTRFLSQEELTLLLETAKQSKWERMHLLIHAAVSTGARRSELLGLKWSDIDFAARTAHVALTKNGDARVLTLTDGLITELSAFREVGHGYVFPHLSSLTGAFQNFDKYWFTALEAAEIHDFRFHDLRHTCASMLAMNGASLLEIGQILGHKSPSMTMRYSHLCTTHKAKLTDRVFGNMM